MFTIVIAAALALASGAASTHVKPTAVKDPIAGLFKDDDYPAESLDKNEQGSVGALIRIDATGAVSDCIIQKSSGYASLDKKTCDVIRERAKFKPRMTRKGRLVARETHKTITWRIAEDFTPSDPWVVRTVVEFEPHGEAKSCRVQLEGAMQRGSAGPAPCDLREMERDVSGETSFGGPIDRMSMEQRFAPGPLPVSQPGADEKLFGQYVLRLNINAAGKPASCKIVEQTGAKAPADPCKRIHGMFEPRNGADGKPAPFTATEVLTTLFHIDPTRPPYAIPLGGSLQGLMSSDDYPPESLDRGDEGRVGILVRVDPKGAVSDCLVEKSSGSTLLDTRSCELIRQRARFKSAVDRSGTAVAGEYRTNIKWAIGGLASDPWVSRTIIAFAPNGRLVSCRVELEGALAPPPGSPPSACTAADTKDASPMVTAPSGTIEYVVTEDRFAIGRATAPPLAPGYELVSRQVMSLAIDASGKLTSCTMIENMFEGPDSDACSYIDNRYIPRNGPNGKPAPFNATEIIRTYYRVEKVA